MLMTLEILLLHLHLHLVLTTQRGDVKPRSMTHIKIQCLRGLILLRQITTAINLGKDPILNIDLEFATSGPNMRDIENSEVEPRSFVSQAHETPQSHTLHTIDTAWIHLQTSGFAPARILSISMKAPKKG